MAEINIRLCQKKKNKKSMENNTDKTCLKKANKEYMKENTKKSSNDVLKLW